MLKRTFDPQLFYRVVVYLRMSSDRQNPRSPDQQLDEINRRLKALGYRWIIVKVYRDDAISGRLLRKRRDYQQMLQDLRSGTVVADLILVDTIERLGRVDEMPIIRKDLFERHGILVLTADSNFADPNTPAGKALGMVESMRSTEDTRIRAHNVLRGKKDAALLKHWPGGPPPFGYVLQSVFKSVNGRQEVDYCILVPNPATRFIIEILFKLAERTSDGPTRLARHLNNDPRIPDDFKPFHPSSIGYWLDSEIYFGELIWAENSTGIVDDTRVVEPNAAEDVIVVPDFCEPLVDRQRFDNVQAIRQFRRDRAAASRQQTPSADGKQIQPLAPGMTLNYLLSGLLFCECGRRMTVSSTKPYITKDGEEHRYVSYVCSGYLANQCPNGTRIPERWIRSVVIAKLRERLFPNTKNR